MVFVDTWAWIALALRRDQHHAAALAQHAKFLAGGSVYVTSDYILSELITQLYRLIPSGQAEQFLTALLAAVDSGTYRVERITPQRFQAAWQLRQRYADKPSISFVDFTSFVIMQELAIDEVFTGDAHFEQVNLGFRAVP
jgi:uncharacterized protein